MRALLYTLKVWIPAILPGLVIMFYMEGNNFANWRTLLHMCQDALLISAPVALVIFIITHLMYLTALDAWKKKFIIAVTGITLGFFTQFLLTPETLFLPQQLPVYGLWILCIILVPVPSLKRITLSSHLQGRHIMLRIPENNQIFRGIVMSELNIWPIKVKLHENAPYHELDLHSLEKEDLFTPLNYTNMVNIKAFAPNSQEYLFTGTLQLDHTLN